MSVEHAIAEKVRNLPLEKQAEVLEHVNRLLAEQPSVKKPFRSIDGILAGRGISVSAHDIDDIRREIWSAGA